MTPEQAMEIMADIAFIFHWSVSDMKTMPISELMDWHTKATKRYTDAHCVQT